MVYLNFHVAIQLGVPYRYRSWAGSSRPWEESSLPLCHLSTGTNGGAVEVGGGYDAGTLLNRASWLSTEWWHPFLRPLYYVLLDTLSPSILSSWLRALDCLTKQPGELEKNLSFSLC